MPSPLLLGVTCFALIIILIVLGVPVAIGLGLAGVIGFYLLMGNANAVSYVAFDFTNNFVLTAIPLFILMGEVLVHGRISESLYRAATKWLAWAPGGLLHANIGACALFSAICGSSPATAAAIASISVPELERRGYDTRITVGSLAGGGTLGILIPPSVNMIVYGALTGASVARLFAGGILPGIMVSVLFMAYIAFQAVRNPMLAPKEKFVARRLPSTFFDLWPFVVIMGVVLGGIFGGIFTPTEGAAIGVFVSMVIILVQRQLRWSVLRDSFSSAVTTSAMVLIIVVGASIVGSFLAFAGVPRILAQAVANSGLSKWATLGLIYLLYLFLGLFMDGISAMLMTLPAIMPIIELLGFDIVWFGVVLVLFAEMATLTPPVAANVFVLQAISKKPLRDVYMGSMPFFFILLVSLVIITFLPVIILWLPNLMMGS